MRCSFVSLLLMVAFSLAACGGGGADGTASGGGGTGGNGTAAVEGLWTGSYTVPGDPSVTIYGALTKGGYAFFYDTKGILYVLPRLTGSTALSGTLTSYVPVGLHFEDGTTKQVFHLAGTASDTAITGTFTGNGITASFTLHPFTPFTGTPALAAGDWQGYYVGSHSVALALTVQPDGTFTGSDSDGCSLSGTIGQKASENLFPVSVTSSGGPLCYGGLDGMAFESSTDADGLFGHAAGTYYYIGVSGTHGGFIAAVKVQ
jgi:hypothetical protein